VAPPERLVKRLQSRRMDAVVVGQEYLHRSISKALKLRKCLDISRGS